VKHVKHIATSFALVCFLTATNGLSLVEHYCSHQKKSYVFLFTQNPNCDDHNTERQSCCSYEETTGCCQNFSKFFKLIADYFSSQSDTEIDCPVFCVEHSFNTSKTALLALPIQRVCAFPEDVGLPEQLLIKQTTELLL
jgi:hypothetical protein